MNELAQMLSAFTAVVAVAAALWTAWESKRLRGVEVARDDRARELVARQHATHVSAWCVICPDHPASVGTKSDGVLIRNASDMPLYEVRIWSADKDGKASPVASMKVLPPGEFVLFRKDRFHWSFPESRETIRGSVRPITRSEGWAVTRVEFTDGDGETWRREGADLVRLSTTRSTGLSPELRGNAPVPVRTGGEGEQ